MIILITQMAIFLFGLKCLMSEVSDKYRDCSVHVFIRWVLMMSSIILSFGVGFFTASSIVVQLSLLFVTLTTIFLLYTKVLKKQIRIKNFKLKQRYLKDHLTNITR